ncbi:MAG: DUF1631 family protein [Pseudomonadota bacterium]
MQNSPTDQKQERRRYPRLPVRHAATVEVPEQGPVHVVVEDFCPGGLFVSLMDQIPVADHPDARVVASGQVLNFTIYFDELGQSADSQVRVARVSEMGFGLAFSREEPQLAGQLAAVARKQGFEVPDEPTADTGVAAASSASTPETTGAHGPIRGDIAGRTMKFAGDTISKVIEEAKDALLTAAGEAPSDVGQAPYFEAMSLLRRSGGVVSKAFLEALEAHLKTYDTLKPMSGQAPASKDSGELSLVDEEEFENWLTMSEIVASVENRNHEALHALDARLTKILGKRVDTRNNPLGPGALCQHFASGIEQLEIGHGPAQVIWRSFGKSLNSALKKFYDDINDLLIEAGVLPKLVFTPVRPRRAPAPSRAGGAAGAAGGYTQTQQPFAEDYLGHPPATPTNSGKIIDLQRLLKARAASAEATAAEAAGQQPLDINELQQALLRLSQSRGARTRPLTDRLNEALKQEFGDEARSVAPQHANAVDLAQQLLTSISQDSVVEPQAKEWISQLEVQLVKMLLDEQDLLSDQQHPARRVLDHLGQAVVGRAQELSGREKQLVEKIDQIVNKLSELDHPSRDAFSEAAIKLEALLKRQHRLRATQLKRVLEAADGQQRLARAREAVTDELQEQFGDREVPKPINDLLGMGWRNLLDVAAVRSGTRGEEWNKVYEVLRQLDQRLDPEYEDTDSDEAESRELVENISERLDLVRAEAGERKSLIAALEALLPGLAETPRPEPEREPLQPLGDGEATAATPAPAEEGAAAAPDGEDATAGSEAPTQPEMEAVGDAAAADAADEDPDEAHWLGLAKLLDKGSWVLYPGPDGKTQPIKLAWISDDRDRYVFVNRNGQKALEIGPDELAEKLRGKQADLIDQPDQPLMDRSWHGMVQQMHDQLAHQATHDQLTECLNRREFERKIRLKLGESKLMHTKHILLQIEIDQFKVVNSTAGHEAGDQLLQDLARVMRKQLPEGGEIARLGGDTFAMLLPRFELAPGHEAAEKLRRAINEHRTRWKRRKLKATASIGLVTVDRDTESVSQVLNQMEIAAGAAKEAGRDRVKSFQIDDQELSQRDQAMRWVTELENALDQDRIVLFGQRIVALNREEDDKLHYEVLCRMRSEQGDLIGPETFIPAAEAYGRIHYLDEWVFRRAFAMLNESPIKDKIARLSINLSGKTFGRPRFLTFIQNLFEETGIEPSRICFEITETAAISNLARCTDFLRELRYLGCRFSLDDFGTGLSSFSYLKHLPVDYLKIDGSFIRDIVNSTADYGLVKTINEIGHFLGKETVAEFVENDEVLNHLKEIGLDFAQGFGIERPSDLKEILKL